MTEYRIESDSLGEVKVPKEALYGAQTVRAQHNFHITGQTVHPAMIQSLAYVKKASALANYEVGELTEEVAKVIMQAADEIIAGDHLEEFATDAIQGGAGTSINMNMNEVLANRAAQLLDEPLGTYQTVHPNDHVNRAQSTNDVIPTGGKLTILFLSEALIDAMEQLVISLEAKAEEYRDVTKVGRTHLQDAVIITFGQVFQSFATMIRRDIRRIQHALEEMHTINMGATAVGTEINTTPGYKERVAKYLAEYTGFDFETAEDLVDGTKHIDGFVYVSSALKSFAASLSRMCNDMRLMASGPKVGLNEITIPQKQPGSSIMPGKVNPVIFEVTNQACFHVIGNDLTITLASEAGQMELNVFEPVLFYNLFQSIDYLTNACTTLRVNGIEGLTVNGHQASEYVRQSFALATAVSPQLGYSKVSSLTKQAMKENRPFVDVLIDEGIMTEAELKEAFPAYFPTN